MDKFQYSIIYAVLRSEISEQLSVGLIIVNGKDIEVRYSKNKLKALQGLMSKDEQKFISRVVVSMKNNKDIKSVDSINYLTRYSNNLISISPLITIDLPPTSLNKDWLYRNYVYDKTT